MDRLTFLKQVAPRGNRTPVSGVRGRIINAN